MKARNTLFFAALCALAMGQTALAGPLRDVIHERRAAAAQGLSVAREGASVKPVVLPATVRVLRDIPYGSDARQRFDVYAPRQAQNAPVILMVHGGGWKRGDKAMRAVVENKVARWVPQGFIVISANYRLLPDAGPLEQAGDIARALAVAQERAANWGGDRGKFILMGHSAGAHLVALLAASPQRAAQAGAAPWLGTVALDSAALDVVQVMEAPHLSLYDTAFGSDPAYWRAASPFHVLNGPGTPLLAVCSTRRADACSQAERFVAKAAALGTRASTLPQDLSHRQINESLGEAGPYTRAVEAFLRSLDASVAKALDARPDRT